MPDPTAEEVARGLTKAQREALACAREMAAIIYGTDAFEVKAGGATIALCKKGLIRDREFRGLTGRSRRGYCLTDTGLAVRRVVLGEGGE